MDKDSKIGSVPDISIAKNWAVDDPASSVGEDTAVGEVSFKPYWK